MHQKIANFWPFCNVKTHCFHSCTKDGKPFASITLMLGLEPLSILCNQKHCIMVLANLMDAPEDCKLLAIFDAKTHCFHSFTKDGKPLTLITLMVGLEPLMYPLQPETLQNGHSKRNGCTRRMQTFGHFVMPKRIVFILAQEMANLSLR